MCLGLVAVLATGIHSHQHRRTDACRRWRRVTHWCSASAESYCHICKTDDSPNDAMLAMRLPVGDNCRGFI